MADATRSNQQRIIENQNKIVRSLQALLQNQRKILANQARILAALQMGEAARESARIQLRRARAKATARTFDIIALKCEHDTSASCC